jgi:uncharacterized protein (UPF0332 family)
MSLANFEAMKTLTKLKNRRSAISQAYYAAFSAVTFEVRKRVSDFPGGYEHPPHNQVGRYLRKHLVDYSHADRVDLRDAMMRLYEARVDADYRKDAVFSDRDVSTVVIDARYVMESLGVL